METQSSPRPPRKAWSAEGEQTNGLNRRREPARAPAPFGALGPIHRTGCKPPLARLPSDPLLTPRARFHEILGRPSSLPAPASGAIRSRRSG